MNEIQSRALLAEPAAAAPIARPALPIRRAAAEAALRHGDGPVELTFDVVRVEGATEAISMILERPDLERTLQSADGEEEPSFAEAYAVPSSGLTCSQRPSV